MTFGVDIAQLPVEAETDSFVLVDASSVLARREDWRYKRREPAAIRELFIHQTQGNPRPQGLQALMEEVEFLTADPPEGRGFPSAAYTFFVAYTPDFWTGAKPVVLRAVSDDVISWHTGSKEHGAIAGHNKSGVAIGFHGIFRSKSSPDGARLSTWQRTVFYPLLKYLFGRYSIGPLDVFTHSDAGKADCPGFELEEMVGRLRDQHIQGACLPRLDNWRDRQQALADIGRFDARQVDGIYGPRTRLAVEHMQRELRIEQTGLWSRLLDTYVRRRLSGAKERP